MAGAARRSVHGSLAALRDGYPGDEPIEADAPTARRFLLGATLVILGMLLPLLRESGAPPWRTLWAEDGRNYFADAYRHGGLAVMFRGYAGYLQLSPRILGALSARLPLRDLPVYMALSAQLVNGLLAWFAYWATAGWIRSRPARLALAGLVVLMPALGYENTANITDTIWTFAAVAPWALVAVHERPRAVALRSAVLFLAATSTPLTVLFVPLAVGHVLLRRTRASAVVAGAFGLGVVVQLVVIAHTPPLLTLLRVRRVSALPDQISIRAFAEYLFGGRGINALWGQRTLLAIAAPLAVAVVLVLLAPGANRLNVLLAAAFTSLAVATLVLPIWQRGIDQTALTNREIVIRFTGPPGADAGRFIPSDRFSFVPVMLLAGAVGVLLDQSRRQATRAASLWPVAFAVHIALVCAVGFPVHNIRSNSPTWSADLAKARSACTARTPAALVPVSEGNAYYAFAFNVRCRDLERGS